LFDPLAARELFAINFFLPLSAVVGTAVVVAFYGLIRGRAFCGWVCPVNLLGEGVEALRTKLNIPVAEHMLPRRTKIGVAAVFVLLSALVGMPVFEAISPIGAVNKGIVLGGFAGLGTLCAVLIADLFVSKRLWCRALCPLGGVYQAIGRVGLVKVHLDHEACIHCDKCTQACLCDPEILKPALEGKESIVSAGDCMACGACIDMCPTKALSFGVGGRFKAAQKHELAGDK
jgi:ferredoxin-type protein NapH